MSFKKSEDMRSFTSCIRLRCCIRIQIHSVRDSQPFTLLDIPQPLSVVLGSIVISKSAPYYYKFYIRIFNSFPVYLPLMVTDIDAFLHRVGNDLSNVIHKISVHFCPRIQRVRSRSLVYDQLAV